MPETKLRCYHLYADGRTVEEISLETYREAWKQDIRRVNTRLLARVLPQEIHFSKGTTSLTIPMAQLRQILGDFEK